MRKPFEAICTELDASLLPYRVRIEHKKGLSPRTLAKQFKIPVSRVKRYIQGTYLTARSPSLPKRLDPKASAIWGIPTFRISCSEKRLDRNSQFHRDSYIPT